LAVVAVLGNITFQVSEKYALALYEFKRTHTYKYAEHEMAKGKARLQRLGKQLDTVTLSGKFVYPFCIPAKEMKRLLEEAERQEALPLVVGEQLIGEFVIEKIEETWIETDSQGHPRVIEFTLELKEYY